MNAKLAEIGAELRQAREAHKLSLADLSRTTLVHSRHLTAIEEGSDEDLPEPFYVKHFIRKYATAVGLQPDELANRFWNTQPLAAPPAPLPKGSDLNISWWIFPVILGAVMLGVVVSLAFVHGRHQPPTQSARGRAAGSSLEATQHAVPIVPAGGPPKTKGRIMQAITARASASQVAPTKAAVIKAVAAKPAILKPVAIKRATRSLPFLKVVAKVGVHPSPSPRPSSPAALAALANSVVSPPPLVIGGQQIAFAARTVAPSWMEIVADGRVVQSGTVPAGLTRKWTAVRSLVVRIGNPGAVYGTLGNRQLGALGTQGSSVFVRTYLTAAGVKEAKASSHHKSTVSGKRTRQALAGPAAAGSPRPSRSPGPSPSPAWSH